MVAFHKPGFLTVSKSSSYKSQTRLGINYSIDLVYTRHKDHFIPHTNCGISCVSQFLYYDAFFLGYSAAFSVTPSP